MIPDDRELIAYHDGELSPRDRARVAAWLATDRAARRRLEELTVMRSLVREWAESRSARFDVSEQVMREIAAPGASRARWLPRAVVASLAAAAAAIVVMARPRVTAPELSEPASVEAAQVPSSGAPSRGEEAPGASVESVDFGENSGSIFVLGSSAGTTTVIWMNDLPENRRRIEPL
jgi:anti-sigma factor RsiW